ncbi:hypothetical protein SLEP1_g37059 [Rubroshorea leprosula]|nr:hypothetical protein SLEP1_g37059 [Rubroshorea leprosula]
MHAIENMTFECGGDSFSSVEAFQSLESMELQHCPMLVGKLPKCLLSLKRLKIVRCPKFIYSPMSLPLLEELYIEACSEVVLRSMVDLPPLKTPRISKISFLTCLPKSFVESITLLEDMEIEECNEVTCLWEEGAIRDLLCLKRMAISNCPLLVSLTRKEQGLLPDSIQTLEIYNCTELESLPDEYCRELKGMSVGGGMNLKSLPFLQYMHGLTFLWIESCEGLESFPERGMSISIPNLRKLWIENCINLKYLPNRMHDLTLLDELITSNSPGIKAIPDGGLPPNLTWLTIDCKNLKQPVQEWGLSELTLPLYSLAKAHVIAKGKPASSSSKVTIVECANLLSLTKGWPASLTWSTLDYELAVAAAKNSNGKRNLKSFPGDWKVLQFPFSNVHLEEFEEA